MQAGIRIIKRGAQNGRSDVAANPVAKSDRERERESVDTVKAWIADWHERKCLLQNAADSLIRSIRARPESSTKRFAVSN
jgi:hypothetical protein